MPFQGDVCSAHMELSLVPADNNMVEVATSHGEDRKPETCKSKDADHRNEVFVARQPIFDRRQKVYGYELLFRPQVDSTAAGTASSNASLRVITNSLLSIGVETLLAGARAFINFPEQLLTDERALSLPPSMAVIEILESCLLYTSPSPRDA